MPQVVDYDEYGYFDVETENEVFLTFDYVSGNAYNALTGEEVTLIGQGINAARDALIGIFGRQGYPPRRGERGSNYPQRGGRGDEQDRHSPTSSPGGLNTRGFQVNWWAAALGGVVLGAFFLGKKR